MGTPALGAGRRGHLDLAGELAEWPLDWHAAYVTPGSDCATLAPASGRVIRDGCLVGSDGLLPPSYRNGFYPTNRFFNIGFRRARSPRIAGAIHGEVR